MIGKKIDWMGFDRIDEMFYIVVEDAVLAIDAASDIRILEPNAPAIRNLANREAPAVESMSRLQEVLDYRTDPSAAVSKAKDAGIIDAMNAREARTWPYEDLQTAYNEGRKTAEDLIKRAAALKTDKEETLG